MVTKPIALWGFMGSGKTSVGKALAQKLNYEFVDTDELVAQRFGKPIPQIFAEDGEAAFRRMETQVLSELIQRQRIVLATGGGMPTVPENLALLRLNALNFYLRVPVEVLYERLATAQDRPLLQGFPTAISASLPCWRNGSVFTRRRNSSSPAGDKRPSKSPSGFSLGCGRWTMATMP